MATQEKDGSGKRLDDVVADAQRARAKRDQGYREQALRMYPWVCGRCSRAFTHANLHELTVHHRNHDHDYNPPDGSNWELLCLYCHDNEHRRLLESESALKSDPDGKRSGGATHNPFAVLGDLLKRDR